MFKLVWASLEIDYLSNLVFQSSLTEITRVELKMKVKVEEISLSYC